MANATRTPFSLKSLHLLSMLIGGFFATITVVAQGPVPDSPAIEAKVRALLAKLTLARKIELPGGTNGVFTCPMPVIGLPDLRMSDGPMGVNSDGLTGYMRFGPLPPSTAFATGTGLAATWDTNLAYEVREAIGRDARARGINFFLGPEVNIGHSTVNGRNFEYLSEDPFLTSEIVVPLIEGIQSQGAIATAKYYAQNNEEYDRYNTSAGLDERAMREIYLPAFEAAVTRARVDAVMNSFLNLKVLKGDGEFQEGCCPIGTPLAIH